MKQFVTFIATLFALSAMAAPKLSPQAEVTILTCSPGSDLYSVFGHSAIRINDPGRVDAVYNYGTFEFSEGFYLKFAQGKLNYRLSRTSFAQFNYEYIVTKRGVMEQVLNLNPSQKQHLFDLLEVNYLPENRYYLYDFFFDNCATRIRDIMKEALGKKMEFHSTFPSDSITFRQMIDRYLKDHHWSDFGIDLALGMPCDQKMQTGENMFLPDFIYSEFASATLERDGIALPLVAETRELLPEIDRGDAPLIDGSFVFALLIAMLSLLHLLRVRSGKTSSLVVPRFILLLLGFVGIAVFLLWFATDHITTKDNWNLVWAFPLHFFVALFLRKARAYLTVYLTFFAIVYLVVLFGGSFFPQQFHPSIYPLSVAGLLTMVRLFPAFWGKSH